MPVGKRGLASIYCCNKTLITMFFQRSFKERRAFLTTWHYHFSKPFLGGRNGDTIHGAVLYKLYWQVERWLFLKASSVFLDKSLFAAGFYLVYSFHSFWMFLQRESEVVYVFFFYSSNYKYTLLIYWISYRNRILWNIQNIATAFILVLEVRSKFVILYVYVFMC